MTSQRSISPRRRPSQSSPAAMPAVPCAYHTVRPWRRSSELSWAQSGPSPAVEWLTKTEMEPEDGRACAMVPSYSLTR